MKIHPLNLGGCGVSETPCFTVLLEAHVPQIKGVNLHPLTWGVWAYKGGSQDQQKPIATNLFLLSDQARLSSLFSGTHATVENGPSKRPIKRSMISGCRKEIRSLFSCLVNFWSLFLTLVLLFSSLFCQTPFAAGRFFSIDDWCFQSRLFLSGTGFG